MITASRKCKFEIKARTVQKNNDPNNKEESSADHVYVEFTLENGEIQAFACHGGSDGGETLADGCGEENIHEAEDLYKVLKNVRIEKNVGFFTIKIPLPHTNEAGIMYGVNGVCHTMANRLLLPSGVTCKKAKGYAISRNFYGEYGLHNTCSGVGVKMAEIILSGFLSGLPSFLRGVAIDALKTIAVNPTQAIFELLIEALNNAFEDKLRHYPRVRATCDHVENFKDILGLKATDGLISKYDNWTQEFHQKMNSLDYSAETPSAKELCEVVNNKINEHLQVAAEFLGEENYQDVFNMSVGEKLTLFDHKALEQTMEKLKNIQIEYSEK